MDVSPRRRASIRRYAGVQKPLFFRENSAILYGDAKNKVNEIVAALH